MHAEEAECLRDTRALGVASAWHICTASAMPLQCYDEQCALRMLDKPCGMLHKLWAGQSLDMSMCVRTTVVCMCLRTLWHLHFPAVQLTTCADCRQRNKALREDKL